MGVRELKEEVRHKIHALYALLVLAYQMDKKRREDLTKTLHSLDQATARQLRTWRDTLAENTRRISSDVGCRLDDSELVEEFERLSQRPGLLLHKPKWVIDKYYFRDFHKVWPGWHRKPPHALIAYDFTGEYCGLGRPEFYLPEAALYEDMCFAYNTALASERDAHTRPVDKKKIKAYSFNLRTAVLSAFYFVEAYLNGVAFDFAVRHQQTLSQRELDALLEWDSQKKREKWLSFREKVLQFPKIILEVQHPPLTENNCDELRLLVAEARNIRDSIVHQSPRPDLQTRQADKTRLMIELRLDQVTQIVDSAVRFVMHLNEVLGKQGQDLEWLFERGECGLFPDDVFK